MRLIDFRVRNFKSIIDTGTVYLSRQDLITILAGQNESGKTSLLKAFKFFEEGNYTDFNEDKRIDKFPEVIVHFALAKEDYDLLKNKTNKKIADHFMEAGISFIRGDINEARYEPIRIHDVDETIKSEIEALNTEILNENNSDAVEVDNIVKREQFDLIKFFSSIRPRFVYYSSFTDNVLPGEIKIANINNNQAVLDFQNVYAVDFNELVNLSDQERIMKQGEVESIASDSLNTYWKQKISGENSEYTYRIEIQKNSSNPTMATVSFMILHEDRIPLKMSQKSQGFKWFSGFILRLRAHEKDFISNKIILLIDEPGQGLHETAQRDARKVIEEISRESKMQIIYSTHQPILLGEQDVNLARLLLVEKTSKKGSKFNTISQAVKQAGAKDALSPVCTALGMISILNLSNKHRALIVEGITEYYYLMTLFGDSDYMIIPSSGVDQISNLYSIALGMGLETKILLDNDKQGKTVANRLRKSFFENDEKAFKKVVLLHDKTGIEELISKATAKKLLEQLGIKYNSNETLIQNIEKSKISKIIFAKTFYDQYINNSQSLDKVTRDNFNKINDFAKN